MTKFKRLNRLNRLNRIVCLSPLICYLYCQFGGDPLMCDSVLCCVAIRPACAFASDPMKLENLRRTCCDTRLDLSAVR